MDKEIKYQFIRKCNRGRRYAILIDDQVSYEEIQKVIEQISLIWGGYETYLIPFSENGVKPVFIEMLKSFDPDYIFSWNDKEIPSFLKEVIKNNCNPFTTNEGNIISKIYRLLNVAYPHVKSGTVFNKLVNESIVKVRYLNSKSKNKLDNIYLYSLIGNIGGELAKELFSGHDYTDFINDIEEVYLNVERLKNIDRSRYFPFDICFNGLNFYYKENEVSDEQQNVYFIIGKSIEDFCYFFNMTRYNSFVFWIYDYNINNIEFILTGMLNYLKYKEEVIDKILFTSSSNYDENIAMCIENINKKLECEFKTVGEFVKFENAYFENTLEMYNIRGDFEKCVFEGNNSIDAIEALPFKGYEKFSANDFRWLTEIEIKNYLPISKYLSVNKDIRFLKHRISRKGLVFESIKSLITKDITTEEALNKIILTKGNLHEAVTNIFKTKDYTWSVSNQGKYVLKILDKFDNNLDELGNCLRDEDYRSVFNYFVKDKVESNIGKLVDKRVYLSLDDIKKILKEDKKSEEIISVLIKKRIIHRGFLIKCNECLHSFWISLSKISDNVTCNQCENTTFYEYSMSDFGNKKFEPVIYYKLDEVFFKAWKNDFDVPILTLNYLRQQSKMFFQYMPEVDIFTEDEKKYSEVDLICNIDGKLVIGECKKPNTIESKQVDKYVHLACAFGFDEVIFSTLSEKWDKPSYDYFDEKHDMLKLHGTKITTLCKSNIEYI